MCPSGKRGHDTPWRAHWHEEAQLQTAGEAQPGGPGSLTRWQRTMACERSVWHARYIVN